MARIDPQRSPPAGLPLRFFLGAAAWALVVGAACAALDPALWASRWHPALLALVHALALGVVGQACLGALLQFLPAAAGATLPLPPPAWGALHAGWNLGLGGLAGGWLAGWPAASASGGALLAACVGLACAALLLALARAGTPRLLRAALALPLLAWPMVAALGLLLLGAMAGAWRLDVARWTDVHALAGVGGVFALLLLAVGPVVLPMLMGARPPGAAARRLPAALLAALLVLASLRLGGVGAEPLVRGAGGLLLVLAAPGLLALARRRHPRNAPLAAAWGLGLLVAFGAGLAWLGLGLRAGLAPGTALLAAALPLLVLSMALEIRTFIAWIALQRAAGRGLQLPGVHLLLPDGPKWAWLALQASAGLAAIALALQPGAMLARVAGGLWVLAALAMLSALRRPGQAARAFLLARGSR